MITNISYNEYNMNQITDLLKKYNAGRHKIRPRIVEKQPDDACEFLLSFEICEVIFSMPEDETEFLLRLSSKELNCFIDKSTFLDKGFNYE